MNYKVYVLLKNTQHGVKVHPVKGLIYNHVINWPDNTKRDEFIDNFIFELETNSSTYNIGDWKKVVDQAHNLAVMPINESSFRFNVNLTNQPHFKTFAKLEMSDFCVVKDENEYKFYALKVERKNKGYITFLAELDIFFTYNIHELFYEKKTMIRKSHWNRRLKKGDNYLPNWNYNLKPLDIDFTPSKKEYINLDEVEIDKNNPTNKEKLKNWENTKWLIFYIKKDYKVWQDTITNTTEKTLNTFINTSQKDRFLLPYTIGVIPLNKIDIAMRDYDRTVRRDIFNVIFKPEYIFNRLFKKDVNLLSVQVVNSNFLKDELIEQYILTKEIIWEVINDRVVKTNKVINYFDISPKNSKIKMELKYINRWPILWISSFDDNNKDYIYKKDIDLKIDFNSIKEPAIYSPAIYQLKIKNYLTNKEIIYSLPQFNSWDNIKIYKEYVINPQESITKYWLEQTGDFYNGKSYVDGKVATIQGWNMPTYQDTQAEYLQNNKNALQTGLKYNEINSALGIGASALSIAGGIAGKSPLAVAGGAFGIGKSIAGLYQFREQKESMLADLANKADVVSTGNNWFSGFFGKNIDTYLIKQTITDPQKKALLDQLKRYGYNINELHILKNVINTRQVFNYIEADDVFNIIKEKLSPKIKQAISDAIEQGLFIWHYRNKNNWKGIINYIDENDEVNY